MRTINEALAKIHALESLKSYIAEFEPRSVGEVIEYIESFVKGIKEGLESVGAKPDDIIMPAGSGRRVVCTECGLVIRPGDEPALIARCADCREEGRA